MRKTLAAVGVALCATATLATPAHADDPRADLVSVSAGNIVISGPSCKYTRVQVQWNVAPNYELSLAFADVYRGTQVVDTHDVSETGNYLWCPYLNGAGTFRFGPQTQVTFYDSEYNDLLAVDNTTGSFQAKYLGRTAQRVTRSGTKVTVRVAHQRYNLDTNTYTAWTPNATLLQYQRADGSWLTYRTLGKVGSSITTTFSAPSARNYRAVSVSSSLVWGRTTPAARA